MNEIMKKEVRMTSVEVCELINQFRKLEDCKTILKHSDLMKKVRKEIETLKTLGLNNEGNISSVEYKDEKGELRPCFSLNRNGIIQICMSESALVRYKMIEYVNKLEEELNSFKLPQNYKEALICLVEEIEKTEKLQLENEELKETIIYKEDIIGGLVDDIDLQTKRQRLNSIMKYKFTNSKHQKDKWNLLYKEFEGKYHVNIQLRMDRDNQTIKPKYKNKLDYIDRGMNKLPQLYEIACKLFESDVEKLKEEWVSTIS